jgi:VanZ family protein
MESGMKKFLIYWLPPILWAGGIFYLSSISGLASDMSVFWDVFWRKLAHATEFGIFNLLLFRALWGHKMKINKAIILSFILAVLYAISDEWHQSFVPNRECRWQDVAQDSLGAAATFFILLFLRYKNILSSR